MIRTVKSINGLLYSEYKPKVWNGHLIIFLHGLGEREQETTLADKAWFDGALSESRALKAENIGMGNQLRSGKVENGFIYLVPQLSTKFTGWGYNQLKDMKAVADVYGAKEVHITGISLGGIGTLSALKQYPGYFKTAGICCGKSSTSNMEALLPTKIKAWHGDKDTTVGISSIKDITARQNALGNPMELVIYPGAGHSIWDRVYNQTDPNGYWAFIEKHVNEQPIQKEPVSAISIVNGSEVHFETSKGVYKIGVTKL